MLTHSVAYLADVVVGISLQHDGDATNKERTEALTSGACQLDVDAIIWQSSLLVLTTNSIAPTQVLTSPSLTVKLVVF